MLDISIYIESDLQNCKKLWIEFSPNKTLWDLWEVVMSFFDEKIHSPHFIVIQNNNNNNNNNRIE